MEIVPFVIWLVAFAAAPLLALRARSLQATYRVARQPRATVSEGGGQMEATYERMTQCVEVMPHWWPHLDEIFAFWVARRFVGDRFHGINSQCLRFNFWDSGLPHLKTWQQYWADGVLQLGTGGGPFDEHATPVAERKEAECCGSLMVKFGGLEGDKALMPMLKGVYDNDVRGVNGRMTQLASTIKNMYRRGMNQEEVLFWAMEELDAEYEHQLRFWGSHEELWSPETLIEEISVRGDNAILVAVRSDTPEFGSYARSEYGGLSNVRAVIQKGSRGHIQVFLSPKMERGKKREEQITEVRALAADVAELLRGRESDLRGTTVAAEDLRKEGKVAGAECWYLVHGMVLNGSETAPSAEPTRIPLEEIVELVKLALM